MDFIGKLNKNANSEDINRICFEKWIVSKIMV